jgi:hypothetical protein
MFSLGTGPSEATMVGTSKAVSQDKSFHLQVDFSKIFCHS